MLIDLYVKFSFYPLLFRMFFETIGDIIIIVFGLVA